MKEKRQVYVYQDGEYVGFFASMSEASKYTRDNTNAILDVVQGKRKTTRKGYHYSQTKLTQEQMDALPKKKVIKKEYKPRFNSECKQISNGFEYEVTCSDHQVTYQARSKEQRKKDFKYFLYQKLYSHWLTVPKAVANLEKTYIQEFLDSL